MTEFTLEVKGVAEIKNALMAYNRRIAEGVARLAVRQGANYMAKHVKALAPVKTGRLRKAIKVKNSRFNRLNRNGSVGVYVTVAKGKSRGDKSGAWYGQFVNNGYAKGSKAVTGRQAVALGVVSNERYQQKKAEVSARRKPGRQRMGIRYRHGGKFIAGKDFVWRGFEASKDQAAKLIVEAFITGSERVLQQAGLK